MCGMEFYTLINIFYKLLMDYEKEDSKCFLSNLLIQNNDKQSEVKQLELIFCKLLMDYEKRRIVNAFHLILFKIRTRNQKSNN